jgi:hypothetical protein
VTVRPWHAADAEQDLAGAALSSAHAAGLVAAHLDLDLLHDLTIARVIQAALALPPVLEVKLDRYDDGLAVLGPHIVSNGQAIVGKALARVVAVSDATDLPTARLAAWVTDLPCEPSPRSVPMWVEQVEEAARLRRAREILDRMERDLLSDPHVLDAVLELSDAL